jgi:hypothetical protein
MKNEGDGKVSPDSEVPPPVPPDLRYPFFFYILVRGPLATHKRYLLITLIEVSSANSRTPSISRMEVFRERAQSFDHTDRGFIKKMSSRLLL